MTALHVDSYALVFARKMARAYNGAVKRVLTVGILALGVLGIAGEVALAAFAEENR